MFLQGHRMKFSIPNYVVFCAILPESPKVFHIPEDSSAILGKRCLVSTFSFTAHWPNAIHKNPFYKNASKVWRQTSHRPLLEPIMIQVLGHHLGDITHTVDLTEFLNWWHRPAPVRQWLGIHNSRKLRVIQYAVTTSYIRTTRYFIETDWRIYTSVNQAIIGLHNGVLPARRRDNTWTNAILLLIVAFGTNSIWTWSKMQQSS